MTPCPVCDAPVTLPANAMMSELLTCPDCGTELEIVTVDPPSLREAPAEEEDWGQ